MNNSPILQTFASAQAASGTYAYSNSVIHYLAPAFYRYFYETDVRRWLYWYDGFVPNVHGGSNNIISTSIGKTIVDRSTEAVFAGGLMFNNADAPKVVDEHGVSKALSFISDKWAKKVGFESKFKKACKCAAAGGTALLKLNHSSNGDLWLDTYRADRFFPVINMNGKVESVKAVLYVYQKQENAKDGQAFAIVEERYYKDLKWTKRVPVQMFSVYRCASTTADVSLTGRISWEALPRGLKEFLRTNYSGIRIGEEQILPFTTLGCYAVRYTDGIDRYNGVEMGESMLHPIMQYLLSYDYYFSCFNTDMYLGRGRVIAKKLMQNKLTASNGAGANGVVANNNAGLDSFLYDQVPSLSTEEQKPTPIQFDLRSSDWREIRNNILESIAFATGLSVGTLASFLNDSSNRTAREISAEENETARFVAEKRTQYETAANDCLLDVCGYYGITDKIEVRWSLSGQTNIDNLSSRVVSEHQAGLRSLKSAVQSLNPDMDAHQAAEEEKRIEQEQQRKTASIFGDVGGSVDLI